MITIKELKKNYGYSQSDLKWITSDILEHLGTIVMAVKFKRTKDADPENNIESEWGSETTQALLLGASEFDPMTETYVMRWKEVDDTKPETEWREESTRIVPVGFSYGDPEEKGEMIRFIPYSLHAKKMETEIKYEKLRHVFNNPEAKMIPIDSLEQIAIGRDKQRILKHIHNLVVVIKPTGEEDVCAYRLGDIYVRHQFKSVWKVTVKDTEGKGEMTLWYDSEDPEKLIWKGGVKGEVLAEVRIFNLMEIFSVTEAKEETEKNK